MNMRDIIAICEAQYLSEGSFGTITTKYGHAEVFQVKTLAEIDHRLSKSGSLRGMLNDSEMFVWDSELAAHANFEQTFGSNYGSRIMIQKGYGDCDYEIEYNVYDITKEDIKANPLLKRIFKGKTLDYTSNEV